MRRVLRTAGLCLVLGVVAAGVFLVPTLWYKPWSIDHFYLRVFAEMLWRRPMLLSQLRVLEPWGIHFHNDDLDDFSVAFQRETAAEARRNLEILRRYGADEQSPEQRFSTAVLDWFLAILVEGEPFQFHDYPLNQFEGVHTRIPDFLVNVHQIRDERGARDYVTRLSRVGAALDQVVDAMRYRAANGVVPPRFVLEGVRDDVAAILEPEPAHHVLYTSFVERLGAAAVDAEASAELRADALAELEGTVYPAYRRVAEFLPDLLAVARDDAGVWQHPNGAAYYAWTLRLHTSSDLDAGEIHGIGLAEVERIQARLREILAGEGYPATDLGATLRDLHREERFLESDDAAGRARVLARYEAIIDEVTPRLPELFGRLPRAPVTVERVPEFKEAGAAGAYYLPPAMDGSKPGTFYANLRSVAEHPRFTMRTLAFHEAVPGHHLQIALAFEMEDVPLFRRVVPFNAFVEGWALYAERLAAEQGFHPTPFDEVGQLVAELFRAARLVVDTGIHAERWTREAAIDYMVANTGMPESDVVAEVERYAVLPGQACSYKVGQLEILRLRERARRALGERFDLREFHDVLLGSGSLPLALLERVIDDWIAASG